MIRLQRISTADTDLYNYMERLMTVSFPPEEYRSLPQLREYTDKKANFYNNIILDDDMAVGFITYWDFGRFYYAEHFAVDPDRRNGGYGKQTLDHLCQLLKRPIVLEVEMPEEEMAKRRIGFYQRQGFVLWQHPYMQPPYKAGDPYLPMRLMAYGNLQCDTDFETVKASIYREVYGVKAS